MAPIKTIQVRKNTAHGSLMKLKCCRLKGMIFRKRPQIQIIPMTGVNIKKSETKSTTD